jgi:hypothetical protein
MKIKMILLALMLCVITIMSCSKDSVTSPVICNCGLIISDSAIDYSVVIRNSCSGNTKKFILYPGDWMTAYVGDRYCISNVNNW